jgi:ABC-2 type transport system ATP-binding protein
VRERGDAGHDQPAALAVDGLVKRFGQTTALAGVSLSCPAGSLTALVGPNGAGKSTLLLTAAGLLALDAGSVSVNGCAAGTTGAQRALSLMPEQPDLYPRVSVSEHVAFIALLHRLTNWQAHAAELLRGGARHPADVLRRASAAQRSR